MPKAMKQTQTYKEWRALTPRTARLREFVRDMAIRGLAKGKKIEASSNWIRFPFYHHVFEDEAQNFSAQLKYLQGLGEFISLDEALTLSAANTPIDGRYFCLTFDDGLKSCLTGALPILNTLDISAVFYVITAMVGKSLAPDDPVARNIFGFKGRNTTLDFMTWEDCQEMITAKQVIGSHTVNHAKLSTLSEAEALVEMTESKSAIKNNLGQTCTHFCAPYGNPTTDFDIDLHGQMAKSAGYASFATGGRGPTKRRDNPFAIKRDHMMANWGEYQLRYFLSLD
jgi:peptidoglycan/xylan/chitin deacetylase (PgdA/CDA1 family)